MKCLKRKKVVFGQELIFREMFQKKSGLWSGADFQGNRMGKRLRKNNLSQKTIRKFIFREK